MFNPAISQRNKELWSLIYTCKRWDLITQHSAIEYRFTKILNKVFTQLKYIIWGFYQVKYTSELWTNSHPSTMWTLSLPWRLTWPGEGLPSCPSTRIRSLAGSLQIATLLTLLSLCPWPMVGIRCWCLTPTSLSMDGRRRTEEHRSTDWENPGLPSKLTHRDLVHHQDLIHRCETLLIYFSILISLYKGFWYCYAWYGAGCWWSVRWCFQRCCYITIQVFLFLLILAKTLHWYLIVFLCSRPNLCYQSWQLLREVMWTAHSNVCANSGRWDLIINSWH